MDSSSVHERLNAVFRHLLQQPCEANPVLHKVLLTSRHLQKQEAAEAVIIGGMVLDIHATPSIPANPRTTTPGKVNYVLGGVARNVAECMSKLGSKPYMISALGLDMAGDFAFYFVSVLFFFSFFYGTRKYTVGALEICWPVYRRVSCLFLHCIGSGVGIRRQKDIDTAVVSNILDVNGELAAAVASVESIEKFLTPDWIRQFIHHISSASVLMVDANLSPPALAASCKIAAECNIPVWFEPVSVTKSRRITSVVKYITVVSPNEDELVAMANALSGENMFRPIDRNKHSAESLFQTLKPAILVLLEKGIRLVVLTLGSDGVLLCSKELLSSMRIGLRKTKPYGFSRDLYKTVTSRCHSSRYSGAMEPAGGSQFFAVHFPALPASVVRLTGAGDCLVGGTLASISSGLDVMQSVAVGIAAAKAAVEAETNVPAQFNLTAIAEGYEADALKLFIEMQSADEHIRMDEFTVTSTLNLCVKLLNVGFGRQLHAFMVKTSNDASGFAVSSLIDMYSKCRCYEEACRVFEGCTEEVNLISKNAMVAACCREGEMEMALKTFWRQPELNDAVSWNTLISGYVQNGDAEEGLKLFVRMGENGVRWNEHTFASALSACCGLRNVKCAKEIHSWVLKNGLISNPFVSSGIVDVYCKCENMNYAESMLLLKGVRNSFSISSMIVGYSLQGNMEEARRHFDSLTEKNVVVWTALFSGYVKAQNCEALFDLLSEFVTKEGVVTDALILVIVLGACALQAALHPGKEIHAYILRMGVQMDKKLISTLVDMYSKCGDMTYAEIIFQNFIERDLVLYNVMIACYAHHGHEEKAILLFEEMLEKGIKPDAVTFVAILSAFRHRGSVEMGEKYFNSMTADYKISPETDHYACMIDLYGRANQLEKAIEFMKNIPTEEDAVILGSFLNVCRLNRNAELAGEAEEKLLRLEGNNKARYVQLANVYAAEGNWAEMGRIRKQMRGMKGNRFAGCSWVYVEHEIHIFTVGDVSHPKTNAIYSVLAIFTGELYEIAGAFY
ncbi:hypothetical protein WN943_024638 [Citrus x changshan-huyou]